ncbi:hypothetical protein Tco_0201573 [Tanacetum coccineum]
MRNTGTGAWFKHRNSKLNVNSKSRVNLCGIAGKTLSPQGTETRMIYDHIDSDVIQHRCLFNMAGVLKTQFALSFLLLYFLPEAVNKMGGQTHLQELSILGISSKKPLSGIALPSIERDTA